MDNTQTPTTSGTTNMTQEEQDLFCFDDIIVMPSVDTGNGTEDIEPRVYLESLETRVKNALDSSKGFHDLVKLAESYEDDSKVNIRLDTTPVRSPSIDSLIEDMSVKETVKVNTPFGEFTVPIPTVQAIPKYQKVLNRAAAASLKTLHDMTLLSHKQCFDVTKTTRAVVQICTDSVRKISKTPERIDILKSILCVMMIERIKEREIAKICDEYSKPEMWVDPLTQGLWIVDPPDQHPANGAARVRKVTSIYEFDDNLTQSLIALCFSSHPRETASAKLNLFSKVRGQKRSDIKENPRKVLATVFSEAELDQKEIKAMIFVKPRETVSICPACDTHVEIDGITYHNQCAVITWLVENFFFKYDKTLGVLSAQRVVYFDHNQRCLLESIQKCHRTLNSPFKIRGGAKYIVMQREGQGFTTLASMTTNPALVPGTEEWMEKKRLERLRESSSRR